MTNDIVTIGSSSLRTKEYRNLRVVTFKDVDAINPNHFRIDILMKPGHPVSILKVYK